MSNSVEAPRKAVACNITKAECSNRKPKKLECFLDNYFCFELKIVLAFWGYDLTFVVIQATGSVAQAGLLEGRRT